MNNAKWILGMLSALSLQISATPQLDRQRVIDNALKNRHLPARVKVFASTPKNAPTPSREVPVRARIMKNTFQTFPDGTASVTSEEVCNVKATFELYDIRKSGDSTNLPDGRARVSCNSTMAGQKIAVNIGGIVVLSESSLFANNEDMRTTISNLDYESPKQPNDPGSTFMAFVAAGSMDIDVKSVVFPLDAVGVSSSCPNDPTNPTNPTNPPQPCPQDWSETFSAVVDVQN